MGMTVRPAAALTEEQREAVLPLATVKTALRIEGDDEDALVLGYRAAAIDWVERYTGRALVSRAWVATFDRFAGLAACLPRGPVSEVTAVGYRGGDGATVALVPADWWLGCGDGLSPARRWPDAGPVTVTFTAGFVDVAAEAPGLLTAALLCVGHWYRTREAVVTGTIATEVPFGAQALADLHRMPVLA